MLMIQISRVVLVTKIFITVCRVEVLQQNIGNDSYLLTLQRARITVSRLQMTQYCQSMQWSVDRQQRMFSTSPLKRALLRTIQLSIYLRL